MASSPDTDDHHELEADENPELDDFDSALGSDNSSDTTSLASSILQYRKENGRTYHKYHDGKYLYPNDELENDRLDLQHHEFLMTLNNQLCLSPVKSPQEVLDLGTGTGIWAIEFADEHPEARVIGVDLSPIQPSFVPPNVQFEVDDVEEPWTYKHKFDFIHSRMMTGSYSDPLKVFKQAFQFMKPGGYLETQDCSYPMRCDDDSMTLESPMYKWSKMLADVSAEMGKPIQQTETYKDCMEKAGFVDVKEVIYKWPINTWPKKRSDKLLGAWTLQNCLQGMQALTMAPMTRQKGWTREEVEVFLVNARDNLKDKKLHGYFPIYVVYGRKPE